MGQCCHVSVCDWGDSVVMCLLFRRHCKGNVCVCRYDSVFSDRLMVCILCLMFPGATLILVLAINDS